MAGCGRRPNRAEIAGAERIVGERIGRALTGVLDPKDTNPRARRPTPSAMNC